MRQLDQELGLSTWFRDHADYHMSVLFSPDGPFAKAGDDPVNTCRLGEPLPYVEPSMWTFPD